MATKSLLQLSSVNTATQRVRNRLKDIAGDNAAKTNAAVAESKRTVVKRFSKLKVNANTVTGADKATIDEALRWGDRVARPLQWSIKCGATAANAWDYGLAFLVGRGVKGLEEPCDLRKLLNDKSTPGTNRADKWTALRQEGALGMLTRLPAAGLGSLVGMCCKTPERALAAQESIQNATIGFNAAVRLAVLTLSAAAIAATGLAVGLGLSGLVALVAVPKLMRLKVGSTSVEKDENLPKSPGSSRSPSTPPPPPPQTEAQASSDVKPARAYDMRDFVKEVMDYGKVGLARQPGGMMPTVR